VFLHSFDALDVRKELTDRTLYPTAEGSFREMATLAGAAHLHLKHLSVEGN
jgi:hypothetical protein